VPDRPPATSHLPPLPLFSPPLSRNAGQLAARRCFSLFFLEKRSAVQLSFSLLFSTYEEAQEHRLRRLSFFFLFLHRRRTWRLPPDSFSFLTDGVARSRGPVSFPPPPTPLFFSPRRPELQIVQDGAERAPFSSFSLAKGLREPTTLTPFPFPSLFFFFPDGRPTGGFFSWDGTFRAFFLFFFFLFFQSSHPAVATAASRFFSLPFLLSFFFSS